MNLLPFKSSTLVKNLPLYTPRTNVVKYLLYANVGLYGLYFASSGPTKQALAARLAVKSDSFRTSLIFYHLGNISLPYLIFNSAILYTIGNYHVLKYGQNHFLRLLALSAAGGSIATGIAVHNDRSFVSYGGMSLSAGLIGYNVFRNPAWFKYALNPYSFLGLLILYSAFYNDRAAVGGLSLGYIAFLAGL